MRKAAIRHFDEIGFPSVKDEEWKYTNIAPLVRIPFKLAGCGSDPLTAEAFERLGFTDLKCNRAVFVDGHYRKELSSRNGLPEGIRVISLAEILRDDPKSVEPYLGRYALYQDQAFNALNTAFIRDGAVVIAEKGKVVEEPIHLVYVSTSAEKATVSYPRNLVLAGRNSQVTIVESYIGFGSGVYFTNPVTELIAGENAVVDHYKLQDESKNAYHMATMQFHLNRDSSVRTFSITLGGSLVRNHINAVLDGEGSECTLNGIFLVSGQQHIDNHTRLEHAKPHCSSRELYKGILDGRSRGVFHGRILVRPGAQKTDSKQTNNNLLLSDQALINTKPQLEIYADDVKCTHGATIGQLDSDAIFYLRSRGIGEQAARSLLIYAFASEIVEKIRLEPLREQLDGFLFTWLPKGRLIKEAF
jgi:Fe-S cluster assembly protein SufD